MDTSNPFKIGPVRPKKEYKMKYKRGTMAKPACCNNSGEVFFLPGRFSIEEML